MVAALRTALIGLLTYTATYCLVAVYGLFFQPTNCAAETILQPCLTLLRNLVLPGRHEAIVALVCAVASMVATVTAPHTPVRASAGTLRRIRIWGEAVVVAAILTVAASRVDPALHGRGDEVATAAVILLAWFVGRYLAGLWADLGVPTGGGKEFWRSPRRRLLSWTLTGMVLTSGSVVVVSDFISQPRFPHGDMGNQTLGAVYAPHVTTGSLALAAGAYALGTAVLLVLAHYASLRSRRTSRLVVGGESLAVRWLLACSLLLAGLLLVAVIAPVASEGTAGIVGGIYGAIAGSGGTSEHGKDCRTDPSLCGHGGPITGHVKIPAHKHQHHRRAPGADVAATIARFALWLIPLVPILYFLWDRRGVRAGRTRLRLLLTSLWQRFRARSARLRAILEARLPDRLADLGASAVLARRGRAARLPVREQIVAYYLNAVGYAQGHGIARHAAQTPEEFEQTLLGRLGTGSEAWTTLTADFIAARYSLDPLSGEQPERARSAWHATRAAIRGATRIGLRPEK